MGLNGVSYRWVEKMIAPDWDSSILWIQTSTPILILDNKGYIRRANPAAAALFHRSENELTGSPLVTFLDPFSREKAQTLLDQAIALGSIQDWELDILIPDQLPNLAGFSADRLQPEGLMLVCRDLSSQMELTAHLAVLNQELEGALLKLEKAHRSLQEAQAQLVQSEKMRSLGQLVAGVAHEINNSLGFVKNNVHYLAEKLPRLDEINNHIRSGKITLADAQHFSALLQDIHELSEENTEGLNRIEKIVLALRNYSRLDEANLKPANLSEGLANTIKLVLTSCHKRIKIETELEPLPEILCNPGELNQVFMNLLMNAVQAIPGEGCILVKARLENNKIVVTFQDNGMGMAPDVLARLGEPFFTTKPVGSGTGLGLAISQGILNRHNASLLFSSRPGAGTLAKIELPILVDKEINE